MKDRKDTGALPSTFLFDDGLDNLMLSRAVQDACQARNLALRQEARAWLWVCCPDVADQLGLTLGEMNDVGYLASSYMDRQMVPPVALPV